MVLDSGNFTSELLKAPLDEEAPTKLRQLV